MSGATITTTVLCQVCGIYPATDFVDTGVVDLWLLCAQCAADERAPPDDEAVCRKCGCFDSDCSGCVERTGEPCYWVEPDLCSACVVP